MGSYKSGLLDFVFPANGACRTSIVFCQFWSLRPQISKVGLYTYNTSLVKFWIFSCNFFWSNVACRWPHPYLHPYHPTFPPPWFTYKMKAHWTYQALATYYSYVQAQTFQICIFNFSQFWRCGLFPAPPYSAQRFALCKWRRPPFNAIWSVLKLKTPNFKSRLVYI